VRVLSEEQFERMTVTGAVVGTPAYMAPEQTSGDLRAVGPAADVWALGVILYRCLAGRLPFVGQDMVELLVEVRAGEPAALEEGVPAELVAACMRCLRKDAVARPSAAELARELEAIASRPPGKKRKWTTWWVAAGVLGAMLAVGLVEGWKVFGDRGGHDVSGTPDESTIIAVAAVREKEMKQVAEVSAREEELKRVADWQDRVANHLTADEFAKAKNAAEDAATVYARHLGQEHWQAKDAQLEAERWERLAKLPREKVAGLRIAYGYARLARDHQLQREHAEAELPLRNALKGFEKRLGEGHPETARCCRELAVVLDSLERSANARPLHEQALAHLRAALGENHPETAKCYRGMGSNLQSAGQSARALPLRRRALKITIATLGNKHPQTGSCYQELGDTLRAMGRAKEAIAWYEEARRIFNETLGKENPDEIELLLRLAAGLMDSGRLAEALPLSRRAAELSSRIHGDGDLKSAVAMNQVAMCVQAQGRPSEALPLYCKALSIRQKLLSEDHPSTATSYNNLAFCLNAQGRDAEALPLFEKALNIRRKVLGEEHPDTATGYNNLAFCLNAQGKPGKALPLFETALQIWHKVLGEEHPLTAEGYNNVALCLNAQGQPGKALPLFKKALQIRRTVLGDDHPYTAASYTNMASSLVAQGESGKALPLYKRALNVRRKVLGNEHPDVAANLHALGLLAARRTEYKEAIRLLQEAAEVYERARLNRATTGFDRTQGTDGLSTATAALAVCLAQTGAAEEALAAAERGFGRGILDEMAGKKSKQDKRALATLRDIQKHLAGDAALVFWLDVAELNEHWACVIRSEGKPFWQRLSGSGTKDEWTAADKNLACGVVQGLADPTRSDKELNGKLDQLRKQRLAIVNPRFKAVNTLPAVKRLVVVTGKLGLIPVDVMATELLISYVPSASVFVSLMEKHRPVQASSFLALGDPDFRMNPHPDPPASGVLMHRGPTKSAYMRLPGTRIEVQAIAAMVKSGTILLGSNSSEQRLDELLQQGKLKTYRLLHFATYAEIDSANPDRSALILAMDRLPDPLVQARQGKKVYDGRLTVKTIRDTWELDADLVVLSACESGMGKETGEGHLGFTQALLSRGARSVIVSRWKVDDMATALLMIRFYENLLGKRPGIKPMTRSASLEDAKRWLRSLPRTEGERVAVLHAGGVLQGNEGVQKTPDKVKKIELKGDHPFAHPYYWAAFTLVGDPD
jgi:CHAT domain-containing protein/tetratricopeptide (TPR) repeat protein